MGLCTNLTVTTLYNLPGHNACTGGHRSPAPVPLWVPQSHWTPTSFLPSMAPCFGSGLSPRSYFPEWMHQFFVIAQLLFHRAF